MSEPTDPTLVRPSPPDETTVASRAVPSAGEADPATGGAPFGRYRLLAELGRGGMGVVWKAWDTQLQRVVALKQILSREDPAQVERFVREARAAARLRHPSIVAVFDVGEEAGQPYFTTEYVEGRPLDRVEKPLTPKRALEIVKGVAEALSYAHAEGIVHRDVKPANILVDASGRPHVMDFGLAKDVRTEAGAALTLSGDFLGTPAYMSPEQARGDARAVGPASDQFSLAAVLYELVSGRRPFDAERLVDLLNSVIHSDPPPLDRRVSRDVATICMKGMEKDVSQRYASMAELAADVGCAIEGRPIHARPVSVPARLWRKAARHPRVATLAVAAVVVCALFGSWGLRTLRRSRETEARKAALESATREMEAGRPALEDAVQGLYRADAKWEDLLKKVEAAQVRFQNAVDLDPQLAPARYLLGRTWELKGWDDRAEQCWRKAIEIDPAYPPAHYELARLLIAKTLLASWQPVSHTPRPHSPAEQRQAAEAARQADAATRGVGVDDPVLREVATVIGLEVRGEGAEAQRTAREAIGRHPGEKGIEDLYWLAAAGEPIPEEKVDLDRVLRIRPTHVCALLMRGAIRGAEGDVAGARADLDEAIRIKPRYPWAYYNRGCLRYHTKDLKGALDDWNEALRIDPGFAPAFTNRGGAKLDLHDLAGAEADFDAALQVDPREAYAWSGRGRVHAERKEWEQAVADLSQAIFLDPECWHAWLDRGWVRLQREEFRQAIDDFGEAIRLQPRDADAYLDRGVARFHLEDMEGAGEDWKKALEVAPEDWPYRAETQKSLDDLPNSPLGASGWVPHLRKAAAAMTKDDYKAARDEYEAALQTAPEDAEKVPEYVEGLRHIHFELACICAVLSTGRSGQRAAPGEIAAEEASRLRERAFQHLREAKSRGYGDRATFSSDERLAPLRDDPRWKGLLDGMK